MADEAGLDRLTLAVVAERCGVTLPGLYKHVSGLEDVKRGIAIAAIRELTGRLAAAAAGISGREALGAVSAAYRDYARAHPGRYAASVRAPAPGDRQYADVTNQALAVISAAPKGYRLEGAALVHAIRMWRAARHA